MKTQIDDQVRRQAVNQDIYRQLVRLGWALAVGLFLSACQFPPSSSPDPTATLSAPEGSIAGHVWLDECASAGICPTTTPGTTLNTSGVVGGELHGLGNLEITLGQGPCPSASLASGRTEPNGSFSFKNLQPGFYCIIVRAADSMAGNWVTPHSPAPERSASYTIALGLGEQRQDIKFVWRPGSPETPVAPTATATATPSCSDKLSLIKDVTIEDGERVDPKAEFTKVWRIRNEGSCIWTSQYSWVFVSGYQLFAPDTIQLPSQVNPGEMIDISLDMIAPAVGGSYRGYWMMRSPAGGLFGTGTGSNQPVWVEIKVGPEPTPVITHWRGEYFDNQTLSGSPSLVRNDKNIDFDWGRKAAADGLPSDEFSVRWTRTLSFDAATYRFSTVSDDGIRLWVDDRLVIDQWSDSDLNQVSVDLAMVSGKHSLKVEYYEHRGGANVELNWKKVTHNDEDKWVARFWFNRTRDSKWALIQTTRELDYNWGSKSPATGIPADDFSASWTRTVHFESAIYRFSVRADDGVRFYIDDELVIDEWHDAAASQTFSVEREMNGSHKLQVVFYEHRGDARIKLDWIETGPANRAPVAESDAYETLINTPMNILDPGVLENDRDPDDDTLTAVHISGPEHGDLVLHENGAFSYQPDPGYAGEDRFIYHASDGTLQSQDTAVDIRIKTEDQLPVAVDDSVETQEDLPILIEVLANDRELGDTPIEIIAMSTPSFGKNAIEGSSIMYTPNQDFSGDDSFTYTISDHDGDQSSAIVSVAVRAINDAPVATADRYELFEDETLPITEPGVLSNDFDVDSSALQVILVETVAHGALELNANGSFQYIPDENFNGEDQFTYKVSDGEKNSGEVTVRLVVTAVEDRPVAVEDSFAMLHEPELTILTPGILINDYDADGDTLIAVLDKVPSDGVLDFASDGSFHYIPNTGFNGIDQFTYWVEDGKGRSESVSVTIEVVSR